jgi:hypothetical protein
MAIQAASYLKGKLGNIVFYRRSGTYIARSLPGRVQQSPATRQRSINFGIASSAGKTLRQLLAASIADTKDKKMQSRFSGAISQWLGTEDLSTLQPSDSIPYVLNFSFNNSVSIAERFKVPVSITQPSANMLRIHIPAFIPTLSIAAPVQTISVELSITAASCLLKDATAQGTVTEQLIIPYSDELYNEQTLLFPVNTGPGSIVITAGLLHFKLNNGQTDQRPSFIPSSVMDARYY